MLGLLVAATLLLAFVNGANDNMKGAATLWGAGELGYRRALALATASTAAGSLASLALATELVKAFSAKGLVPDAVLDSDYLTAVALAGAATVLLATRWSLPVSTTHALVGGLAGAGVVAAGSRLDLGALGGAFALPLLVSPLLAIGLAAAALWGGRAGGRRLGLRADSCVCVAEGLPLANGGAAVLGSARLALQLGNAASCPVHDPGGVALSARSVIRGGHLLSACLVGFARGVNDTPKILGLLVAAKALSPLVGALALTGAMALGGWLGAHRVAETLARRLTPMTPGQGLAANAATAALVIGASRLGLPVSTTHVSTGGIFGIGLAGGELRWRMAGAVLTAWVTTLPLAAALGALCMWVLA